MSSYNSNFENNDPFSRLTNEEKVQVARETNRLQLPREVVKWLQSLDLSYKIKSISKDVANGFSIAEILSRYPVPQMVSLPYRVDPYYRVSMQEFGTGSSLRERQSNWAHLKDILTRKYNMPLPNDLPDKIVNKSPNAAFEFLIMLYKFLTKRKVTLLNKHDETDKFRNYQELENLPSYMKPTANRLVRDIEVQRIKDDLIRNVKLEEILDNHKKYCAIERENFKSMEEYNKNQEQLKKIENSKNLDNSNNNNNLNSENKSNNNNNDINEVNESQSQLQSSENNKEEKVNLMGILNELTNDSREVENIENEFRLIIRKNFVESDRNIEMDLKNYSADKDVIDFFFEKIDLCTEDNLNKIFNAYEDKEKDFISIITRTLTELIPFINLICKFFENFYKNEIPWVRFKKSTLNICNTIHENTKEKCDNIFINFCLNKVLDMISKNPLYRNEMCQIIFSLTSNNSENHFNILKKISKKFSNKNELLFYHILVQCMNNIKETENILNEDIVYFYNDAIVKGITNSNDVIVMKSIYLINLLMRFDYLYCLKYYKNIFKHINSFNWEILSLILIYCSKMLELFNRQKFEREQMESGNNDDFNKNKIMVEGEENNVVNEEKKDNENISQISHQSEKSKKSQATNQSKKSKNEEEKNNNEENNVEQPQENNNNENENEENHNKLESLNGIEGIEKDPHIEEENKKIQEELNHRINEIQKCENDFLSIIDHIFSLPSPHMTIKIGFIYLAEVLEYYPELAKKYMKLLIEYKDNTIRKEVLLVEQSSEEYEYTINCYTERYKFCGAPYFWNQLKIAGIFRDYVLENLERFESNHLLILHSIIIHQEFNESDAEDWINLYNDLKKYLFVALCEKQFSGVALSILDKIFSFTKILQNLLDHTFDLFINTMKIIYGDDVMDEPHKNMKTLLTTISEIKAEGVDCKTYVYTLIKTFAIQNDKKYLKSNLLDLLNSIYFEKRGNIFEDEPKD